VLRALPIGPLDHGIVEARLHRHGRNQASGPAVSNQSWELCSNARRMDGVSHEVSLASPDPKM